jgi:cell division protease FtsH
VRRLIEDAYAKAEELLRNNIDKLHLIAKALMERETLEGAELEELLKNGKIAEKEQNDDDDDGSNNEANKENPADEEPEAAPVNADTNETDSGSGPKIVYISRDKIN